MTRRNHALCSGVMCTAVALTLFVACGRGPSTANPTPPQATPKPNVLLITIDTLRADALGYRGGRAATPVIDRLAKEGLNCEFAHAHSVVTLPSHTSILTGLYPYQHGVRDNSGFRLSAGPPTLATILRDAGYTTAAFVGAFPLDGRFELDRGFDTYDDRVGDGTDNDFAIAERPADVVVTAALDWVKGHIDKPWFMWVHMFDPHAPYRPPSAFAARHPAEPYLGEVEHVDQEIGRLLQTLSASDRPTLSIFTADHGEALGDHGELTHGLFAYEPTLAVPLIFHLPSHLLARPFSGLARHIDIVPTVLDLLGVAAPAGLSGRSLRATTDDATRLSYFEAVSPHLTRGWAPLRGLQVGREKFIDLPIAELYDLAQDPHETHNLAVERPDRVDELRQLLHDLPGCMVAIQAQDEAPEVIDQLRSLGYLGAGSRHQTADKTYTGADDPKTLLPLDRALHNAVDLYQTGRSQAAEVVLRDVLKQRPDFPLARVHLAYILRDLGQIAAATVELRGALDDGYAGSSAISLQGVYLTELGRTKEALTLLSPWRDRADADLEVLNALGVCLASSGDVTAAQTVFNDILVRDRTNASALVNLGTIALESGDTALARQRLNEALALDHRLVRAWNGLGVIQAREGEVSRAIDSWSKAVAINPRAWDTRYNLAVLLARTGRNEEARHHLEAFVAGAPEELYGRDLATVRKLLEGGG